MNNLLTFKQTSTQSVFDDVTFYERLNIDALDILIQSDVTKPIKSPINSFDHEKTLLLAIKQNIQDNPQHGTKNIVNYKLSNKRTHGRVYPAKSLSLGAMSKKLRHTLSGDYYNDIDIANCHPSILSQIATSEGMECGQLKYYIDNRERCLEQICQVYDVNRSAAKELVIRICYGGEYATWLKDTANNKAGGVIEWVDEIEQEMSSIADIVMLQNQHLIKEFKDDKRNLRSSVLSVFAQDVERKVLEEMYCFMAENQYIKITKSGFVGAVLCFDGIMVPKKYIDQESIDDILAKLSQYVLEKTGLNLAFTEKAMDEGYDIELLRKNIPPKPEGINPALAAMFPTDDPSETEMIDDELVPVDITHSYISLELLKLKGDNFLYSGDKLYFWTGDIWDWRQAKAQVRIIISDILYYKLHERVMANTPHYVNTLPKVLKGLIQLQNQTFRDKVFNDVEDRKKMSRDDTIRFNFHPTQNHNIHFKNGVLMLNKIVNYESIMTVAFRKREKEDYMTSFNNYNFVHSSRETINKIRKVYQQVQHIPEHHDYWLRFLAYCLTGDNNQQVCEFDIGYTAQNAKSTHLCIHQAAMPFYTMKIAKDTFEEGNQKTHKQLIKLIEKPIRLAYMEELNTNKMDPELVKEFVDGHKISIEVMYGTRIEESLQAKLKICSNHDPNIKTDQGVLRRGVKLDFVNRFVGADKYDEDDPRCHHIDLNLLDKFESDEHRSAYILMLVPYYSMYVHEGLGIPTDLRDAFKNSIQEFDDLGSWLESNVEKSSSVEIPVERRVSKEELLRKIGYEGMKNGWRSILPRMKALGYEYDKLMYCGQTNNGKRVRGGFKGCAFIQSDDNAGAAAAGSGGTY